MVSNAATANGSHSAGVTPKWSGSPRMAVGTFLTLPTCGGVALFEDVVQRQDVNVGDLVTQHGGDPWWITEMFANVGDLVTQHGRGPWWITEMFAVLWQCHWHDIVIQRELQMPVKEKISEKSESVSSESVSKVEV